MTNAQEQHVHIGASSACRMFRYEKHPNSCLSNSRSAHDEAVLHFFTVAQHAKCIAAR